LRKSGRGHGVVAGRGHFSRARLGLPVDQELYTRAFSAKWDVLAFAGGLDPGDGSHTIERPVIQRATVVAPTSYSYELLGLLYGEMRRMSDAKRALDTAVSLVPAAESPYLSRAYWYEVTKDYAGARTDYSRALAINPTNFLARAKLLQLAE
jgi:tetratricopeptide (TPR) repeat protein